VLVASPALLTGTCALAPNYMHMRANAHTHTAQSTTRTYNAFCHPYQKSKEALQPTATHCNTLQHTVVHCNTLQYTAAHCNTLQHIAIHCSTHLTQKRVTSLQIVKVALQHIATYCSTLQLAATHCNTLHNKIWHRCSTLSLRLWRATGATRGCATESC